MITSPLRCTYDAAGTGVAAVVGVVGVCCSSYISTGPLRDLHELGGSMRDHSVLSANTDSICSKHAEERREEEECTYKPSLLLLW
jgi:hypothetical protein